MKDNKMTSEEITATINELLDRGEKLLGPKKPDTRNKEEIIASWKEKMRLAEDMAKFGDELTGEHTAEGDELLMKIYSGMMENSDWLSADEVERAFKAWSEVFDRVCQREKREAAETFVERYDKLAKKHLDDELARLIEEADHV